MLNRDVTAVWFGIHTSAKLHSAGRTEDFEMLNIVVYAFSTRSLKGVLVKQI